MKNPQYAVSELTMKKYNLIYNKEIPFIISTVRLVKIFADYNIEGNIP